MRRHKVTLMARVVGVYSCTCVVRAKSRRSAIVRVRVYTGYTQRTHVVA